MSFPLHIVCINAYFDASLAPSVPSVVRVVGGDALGIRVWEYCGMTAV